MEKQEEIQSTSQETEERLTNELESVSQSLEQRANLVSQLEAQVGALVWLQFVLCILFVFTCIYDKFESRNRVG